MARKELSPRNPPVLIPLSFDEALTGLLAVDPTDMPKTAAQASNVEKRSAAKKSVKPKGKPKR